MTTRAWMIGVALSSFGCGGSASSAGTPPDGGHAGTSSAGGASSAGGKSSAGGRSSGGAGGASGAGSGGSSGTASCLDASRSVLPAAKRCATDSECGQITVPTCCGSDGVVGIRKDANCTVPGVGCNGLGCAKFTEPMAEDGQTQGAGETIESHCVSGACKTRVVSADAGARATCGSRICAANQVCVHPPTSVGGAVPQCVPATDAAACPAGTQWQSFCGGSAGGGCIQIYVPPPSFCVDIPPACGPTLACACFPSNLCGGGADFCNSVTGHDLRCINLAP